MWSPTLQAADVLAAGQWIEKASLPVAELQDIARVHGLIDALGRRLDGTPAVTQTYRRRRAVRFTVLEYAVETEALTSNPLTRVRHRRGKRTLQEIDRRVVVNPRPGPGTADRVHLRRRVRPGLWAAARGLLRVPALRGASAGGGAGPPARRLHVAGDGLRPYRTRRDAARGGEDLDGLRRGPRSARAQAAGAAPGVCGRVRHRGRRAALPERVRHPHTPGSGSGPGAWVLRRRCRRIRGAGAFSLGCCRGV